MSSYISARLPGESLTDLPAFLCTEFTSHKREISPRMLQACAKANGDLSDVGEKKDTTPTIMKIADALLGPLRIFTKFEDQKIGFEGVPSEKELTTSGAMANGLKVAAPIIFVLTSFVNKKAVLLNIPFYTNFASVMTPFVKTLSSKFATWIDEKTENTNLRNISKITVAAALLTPVAYILKEGFPVVAKIASLSQSQLALCILGYLGTTFAVGASLKLYAYHNDPKVNGAYNTFLKSNRV